MELHKIFTASFKEGKVPKKWKDAHVTPIYKKGSRVEAGNYRPVSLTVLAGRLMESMIKDEMVRHLCEQELIANEQHGFVLKKSCLTNLLESIDLITEASNRGFTSMIVFMDFAKAFDKVCHRALLKKLKAYGFDGKLLEWIEDFLKNRRQRVVIGEFKSDWLEVLSGVPQGSCLGPLLFVLFINDMPNLLENVCKLFADDTKLIGTIKNSLDLKSIQSDVDRLEKWAKDWLMSFNEPKCKYMVFNGNKNLPITLNLNNKPMMKTDMECDLGIHITSDLKWNFQASNAATKANLVLGQLRKAFRYWTINAFKKLYLTFVRPHLEYAVSAWCPYVKKDIAVLEAVQKRATKLVSSLRHLPYEQRLEALGLTTLVKRRERADMIEQFKISNGLSKVNWHIPSLPCNSLSMEGPAGNIRGSKHRLVKQFTRIRQRQHFMTNRIVDTWNKLPEQVVRAKSKNSFKNKLDALKR